MFQQWRIGEVEVTCVTETMFDVPPEVIVRDFDPAQVEADNDVLQPDYLTDGGMLRIAIQSFAIISGGHRLIVDTCFGNDHELPYFSGLRTNHLDSLASIGFDRSVVDSVVCTHLHMDHVGWNTMLEDGRWVPTFPNAAYLFSEREYEHWRKHEQFDAALAESIDPILDGGLHRFVDGDHRITNEVALVATPGHTPGHVSVRIDSRGESALITGDMVHHPVQVFHPEWASLPDDDPVVSVATRAALFPDLAERRVLVMGTHFAEPTAGHIRRDGAGWAWHPRR